MDTVRRELADVALAVCRLLLQASALEKEGYFDLADALRAQAEILLSRERTPRGQRGR